MLLILSSSPSFSANPPKTGSACSKQGLTKTFQGKTYTCLQAGKKLVWGKGLKVKKSQTKSDYSPTPTQSATPEVTLPKAGTPCKNLKEKITNSSGFMKCSWNGGEITNTSWRFFPSTLRSSSKSNNYKVTPKANSSCDRSGDTFDIAGGFLECRWVNGKRLQWIQINSVKKSFVNAKSPVSLDTCKLQNSDSSADRTGRNQGAGMVGFPLVNSDKNGMYISGSNEVLIAPIDFSDFPGFGDLGQMLEYDKKWMTDWYQYYSSGKSIFNVTTIDNWIRMPKSSSSYAVINHRIGIDMNPLKNTNELMGLDAQPFIDEITKLVDLRKFSTVYIFTPEGFIGMNDLIVRGHTFKIKEGEKRLNFFSWGKDLEAMETLRWSYYIHETLHDFNIIGHAPGNGWPIGMMQNQSGISYALNSWEQFVLGWLPDNQIYCDDLKTLKTATISLTPLEREDRQTKMAVIKLSPTQALVVESHGIDKWSSMSYGDRNFPPGFYSVMAYVVDLDKSAAPPVSADGKSGVSDDYGWGIWKPVFGGPSNDFDILVGANKNLGNYVAVLGDSFVIEGVRIEFIGTGDYETIRISRV